MQQFGAFMFFQGSALTEIRWGKKMSTSYIIISLWPYLCQKLLKLV